MMTNAKLQQMYHEFNTKWFSGKLPRDMIARYAELDGCSGITYVKYGRPLYIEIDRNLRVCRGMTATTLLHEMCHVKDTRGKHGPRFHKEMLRLAKAGAMKPWW
jgi:hypothetical protein